MEKRKKLLLVIAVSFVLIVVLAGVGIKFTSRPAFCSNCHEIAPRVASWQESLHGKVGVGCLDCHAGTSEVDVIKRKAASVRELYIQMTDPPKVNEVKGDVPNSMCLACHSGKPGAKDITKLTGNLAFHKGTTIRCSGCHKELAHKTT